MKDQLEIGGDLQDEMTAIQEAERLEASEGVPESDDLTDEDMDDWAMKSEGKDAEGVPCWNLNLMPRTPQK